jgi:polyisoprenoid-binding protein YceI
MRHATGLLGLTMVLVPLSVRAETFTFDVPEKLINIAFESRMEIEDIVGFTHKVSGWVKRDQKKDKISFRVEVPVASLRSGVDRRDEHLRSPVWLDAKKYPTASFAGKSARKVGKDRYEVKGSFTLHGKARPLKLQVQAALIPRATAERLGLGKEDWLRVRGSFTVRLSDHGVKIPKMTVAKVNDVWTVRVSLFAKAKQEG